MSLRGVVGFCILLAVVVGASVQQGRQRESDHRQVLAHRGEERRIRDADIDFFARRVKEDPTGAIDLAKLGGLYLRRARETGNNEDILRAERAARRSIENRRRSNSSGYRLLANSLMGQHRFAEAREAAFTLTATDDADLTGRALLGEIDLELGRYHEADSLFNRLRVVRNQLTIAPRYARWAELRGRAGEARRLLADTRRAILSREDLPSEQVAWFDLRLGEFALRMGASNEATMYLAHGLQVAPDDWRLLGALARLAAARGDARETIEYGERAIAQALDPATLGVVGDAYRTLGDTGKAEEYVRAMETAVATQLGPYHRAWSLYLLDHNRRIPDVLANVKAELQERRDVYGYDLLAWALYKSARFPEAQTVMHQALAVGTEDPLLQRHARAIEAAAAGPGA